MEPGPDFSVQDVHRGWVKGLRENGCQVASFNFNDRLMLYNHFLLEKETGKPIQAFEPEAACRLAANGIKSACYEYWPDLILVTSGFFVPPDFYELFRARGHKVALICTEEPYEFDRQIEKAELVDLVILNDPTNLDLFREVNPNTHYIGHAYDPEVHHPREAKEDLASDFCFVGTGYQSRIDFLESVDWTGVDVALAGNWQALDEGSSLRKFVCHNIENCVDNDEAHDLYASTKCSANLYRKEATEGGQSEGWAMGPREVELAASETFFLRESRPESDIVLKFLPSFDGPEDFGDKVRWYLKRPDARELLAARAREAVADRTFQNNAARLLRLLDA